MLHAYEIKCPYGRLILLVFLEVMYYINSVQCITYVFLLSVNEIHSCIEHARITELFNEPQFVSLRLAAF